MRSRFWVAVCTLALIASLVGWGWFASGQARDGWWALGQHVAVGPDDQGVATLESLGVRLLGVEEVAEVDEEQPPAGLRYLAVELSVSAEEASELRSCDVLLRDESGRLFEAGAQVPREDPYVTSLTCGTSDPAEEPVPQDQSLLVLVPEDAELDSVRVVALDFPPARFLELPLP